MDGTAFRNTARASLFAIAMFATTAWAGTPAPAGGEAAQLRARYDALAPVLAHNDFGRPIALESREDAHSVSGDVYAVLDYPFATVNQALRNPRSWCDVLILHLNTKYCRADGSALSVRMGRKNERDLDDTFALAFAFRADSARADFVSARAASPSGPLGSRDYRISMQAMPLPNGRSFMRLHYSYAFGTAARLATKGYLATSGSGKIGFTREGKGYVRGLRGAVERNAMRYYLAVESYLASKRQSPGRQFASRIERWFDATERYSPQLHEMDRASYLAMKQREYARQNELAAQ
jgi:hypothetical protein